MRTVLVFLLAAVLSFAQIEEISAERIRAHVKFLAGDSLEGRGVGTRGETLATEYLATQFALAGAKPAAGGGTYFQRVPLVGVKTDSSASLVATASGQSIGFDWLTGFVGATQKQTPLEQFDAEAVFAGHGISAPEWSWDDYKGADVRGKVLILFTNEPQPQDPKLFDGPALTYYGRWTYKFEEAQRRGAVAALLIHTVPTAGYGWDVVRNSWGREDAQVKLRPGGRPLAFTGWIAEQAGDKLLALAGRSVNELLKLSGARNFRPIPLGVRVRGRIPSQVRDVETRNVAATIPGSDSPLRSDAVVFTAHWDHLGIGLEVGGDSIYNGAVDNATGCAILLEISRAWAALNQKPRGSALFLATTAEEGGLRGSQYYADHPIFAPENTILALNFDALHPLGRPRGIVVAGAERTPLWPVVQEAAARFGLALLPDPHPEQGSYFRSDHFPLVQAGIPAFSVKMGTEFAGKRQEEIDAVLGEFGARHYHQPSDEYRESWDFSGLEHIARLGFLIGFNAANARRPEGSTSPRAGAQRSPRRAPRPSGLRPPGRRLPRS